MDLNMKVVKKNDQYRVLRKRSGRYAIRNGEGDWINGPDKIKILLEAGLIKATLPKEPTEASGSEESEEPSGQESETTEEQVNTEADGSSE